MCPIHDPSFGRVGIGFDFHQFSDQGTLVLGGLPFEGYKALEGHSDADVLIHAAMDAVLGAAGDQDIGTLFPDRDHRYLNADSKDLAKEVMDRVRNLGFEVVNMDAVLICDEPKIAPHREAIRKSLAKAFGLELEQVNLKGKTTEGVKRQGEKGVEAFVVALLRT